NLRASAGIVLHFGGNPPPPPPNHPPTVTLTANPTKVFAGSNDSIVLQSQAADPDNDPLTYKWTATGGAVEGTGAETRWNSTGVAPGTYTITCSASDGHGGEGHSTTQVTVQQAKEQAQLEQRLSLHSIYFPTAQPLPNSPVTTGLLASQKTTLLALAGDFKK